MKRLCLLFLIYAAVQAASLSGTWKFSVDLEDGNHGDPTFDLKEANGSLSGTYRGPFGEQTATGTVVGKTIKIRVAASSPAGTLQLDYAGTLASDDTMTGTMTRDISGQVTAGKWTATRKK